MRKIGDINTTLKYNCCITILGEVVLNENYTTLKKLSKSIDIPYDTVTDVFEGRRASYMKWCDKKYFPSISITRIINQ